MLIRCSGPCSVLVQRRALWQFPVCASIGLDLLVGVLVEHRSLVGTYTAVFDIRLPRTLSLKARTPTAPSRRAPPTHRGESTVADSR